MNIENNLGFEWTDEEMALYIMAQSESEFQREVVARCTDRSDGARISLLGTEVSDIAKQTERNYRREGKAVHLPEALYLTQLSWEQTHGESADHHVAEVLATCYETRQIYQPEIAQSFVERHPDWTPAEIELGIWASEKDMASMMFAAQSGVSHPDTLVELSFEHPVNTVRQAAVKNLESRQDLLLTPMPDIDRDVHLKYEVRRKELAVEREAERQSQQQPQQGMEL